MPPSALQHEHIAPLYSHAWHGDAPRPRVLPCLQDCMRACVRAYIHTCVHDYVHARVRCGHVHAYNASRPWSLAWLVVEVHVKRSSCTTIHRTLQSCFYHQYSSVRCRVRLCMECRPKISSTVASCEPIVPNTKMLRPRLPDTQVWSLHSRGCHLKRRLETDSPHRACGL